MVIALADRFMARSVSEWVTAISELVFSEACSQWLSRIPQSVPIAVRLRHPAQRQIPAPGRVPAGRQPGHALSLIGNYREIVVLKGSCLCGGMTIRIEAQCGYHKLTI